MKHATPTTLMQATPHRVLYMAGKTIVVTPFTFERNRDELGRELIYIGPELNPEGALVQNNNVAYRINVRDHRFGDQFNHIACEILAGSKQTYVSHWFNLEGNGFRFPCLFRVCTTKETRELYKTISDVELTGSLQNLSFAKGIASLSGDGPRQVLSDDVAEMVAGNVTSQGSRQIFACADPLPPPSKEMFASVLGSRDTDTKISRVVSKSDWHDEILDMKPLADLLT